MTILRTDLDLGRIDLADWVDPTIRRLAPIHPGAILREEWLEPLEITAYRAAMDMGVPANRHRAASCSVFWDRCAVPAQPPGMFRFGNGGRSSWG
jgi:hypothetical protein